MQPFLVPVRGCVVNASDADVYACLKDDLVRYATVLVGPDAAPDVVSTVVVRVLARRHLTDLENPRAYLFRGVLNEARSTGRQRSRPTPRGDCVPAEDAPNLLPEVAIAVAGLPVRQRAATFLVYWMGFTVEQTATSMGVGAGTVKRYLSLARDSLREVLSEHA
jgi:RNA polymerase sigma factor (sigma-70 family)